MVEDPPIDRTARRCRAREDSAFDHAPAQIIQEYAVNRSDLADAEHNPSRPSVRVPADVISQRLGDDTVLVNIQSGWIYELDQTGAAIWKHLRDGQSPSEIIAALEVEYSESVPGLAADVTAFIETLADEGLVEVDSDARP